MFSELANRHLTVAVFGMIFDDGALEPPAVGDVVEVSLEFVDGGRDSAVSGSPHRVLARPIHGCAPASGRDGTLHWPITVTGDGWSASWSSTRPVRGPVRLDGTLHAMTGADAHPVPTRGRVQRIRLLQKRIEGDTHDPRVIPRVIEGWDRLVDVETTPHRFWSSSAPLPGHDDITAVGVLLDLDLDDVPAPIPTFVPGWVSTSGTDTWVMERSDPILRHVDMATDPPVVTEYLLPLTIEAPTDYWRRIVHADGDGCWITSEHDVFRCDREGDGTVTIERRCTDGGRSVLLDGRLHILGNTRAALLDDHRYGLIRRDPDPHPVRVLDADGRLRPVADPHTADRVQRVAREQLRARAAAVSDGRLAQILASERLNGVVHWIRQPISLTRASNSPRGRT